MRRVVAFASPVEWILLPAGLFLVLWYAWFLDDAYVFFRYVDNWVLFGEGLVYNPGEYVEGYSSPGWCLLLALLRSLHLSYWTIVRLVGLACFAAFWVGAVVLNRRLSPVDARLRVNLPLLLGVTHYAVMTYFTSGLESPFVILAALGVALHLTRPHDLSVAILLGLAPLFRQELALTVGLLGLWAIVRDRRLPWPMFLSAATSVGGWLVFRVWYYADFFPNTFHLKDLAWYGQGLAYLWDSVSPYQTHVVLVVGWGLLGWLVCTRPVERRADLRVGVRLGMIALALPIAFYVVRIGGDPRHYRYLLFPLVLATFSLAGLPEWIADRLQPRLRGVPLALALALGVFTLASYPDQLEKHPLPDPRDVPSGRERLIGDAAPHRIGSPPIWTLEGEEEELALRLAGRSQAPPPGRKLAVKTSPICRGAYLAFDQYAINSFGLTDPVLARMAIPSDWPAHKFGLWSYASELGAMRAREGIGKGVFAKLARRKRTPAWVAEQLPKLEQIEKKAYNDHHFFENLRLAITPIPPLDVEDRRASAREARAAEEAAQP